MIKNYFKVAWRNLMKNKVFSFINVFGLSIGFVCCMLMTYYIYHETIYDRQQKNSRNLYQVGTTFIKEKKEERTPNTPSPLGVNLKAEFPEIVNQTKLLSLFLEDKTLISYFEPNGSPHSFYETKGFMADSNFFQLFTYNFIQGNQKTALKEPFSIVLSEEIAGKFFPSGDALNKIVHISSNTNGENDYKITGVFKPSGSPSHIDARFFISMYGGGFADYVNANTNMANNNMFFTYILLRNDASAQALESKLPAFIDKYAGKDLKAAGFYKKQFLIPVRDIHLYAGMDNDVTPVASVTYLYILGSIALFTLLIACINFMNLSTARSSKRSAEVGVRKVLGAEKRSLVWQFLGESVLMALLAMLLGIIIFSFLLPAFSTVSGKEFHFSLVENSTIYAAFFVLALLTGIIAGSYPAFFLSSFRPIKVLKGKFKNSLGAIALRKGLVVFQFIISAVLIISSLIISRQMNFLRSADLGFAKDQQLVIPLRSETAKKIYGSLRNEISSRDYVLSAGASESYPGIFNPRDIGLYKEGQNMALAKTTRLNLVDDHFLSTMQIKAVAGRLFYTDSQADTLNKIIVNQKAALAYGFHSEAEAIGKSLYFDWDGKTNKFEIIGVVKDFNFQDLHQEIVPYGFWLGRQNSYNYLIAHLKPGKIHESLSGIEAAWHRLNPNEPFEYSFLDQDFQHNYQAEDRLSSIVSYFTLIAIIISCMGLFGLAVFSAEQRTKEIGVRKVLGASVSSIVSLLSKDFVNLVIIGVVVASPLAWLVMNKWLQNFAYRTSISWEIFVVSFCSALVLALATISIQAFRAARANPVKSLRSE